MIKCPCENCICIAVCRHKPYFQLFQKCILLRIYEPAYNVREQRDVTRIEAIYKILKPREWIYVYRSMERNHSGYVVTEIRRRY